MELRKLNRRKTAVKLPKLGWVKFRASRSLEGETLRSATLSKEGAHWFVSLPVEDGVSTSAGDLLDQVFTTAGERRRALGLQRKLSRAAKGSANRNKIGRRYAGLRAREARRRQDFCVKTARALAQKNAVVVLEKLSTRNMTRRAKPVEDPDSRAVTCLTGRPASRG
jgi:putative transposase